MYLYIHIPFCESKCKYCRFASSGNIQKLKIEKYIDFIISPLTPLLPGEGNLIESIYFGGGTPGVLSLKQLKKVLNHIKAGNKLDDNIEITLESTPNKVTKENLIGWKKLGINRLSIGVQSLNNKTLEEIGRGDKGDILEALDNIKNNPPQSSFNTKGGSKNLPFLKGVPEGGGIIDNISLDFIIGLPHTKKGDVKKDIEYILNNYDFVKHISVYMLEEYYYPDAWKGVSIKDEDYLGEYIEIKNYLEEKGFNRYEVSNFAKPGYECKHNQAYWNHSEVLGLGLGAHSFVRGYRYANSDNFKDYYDGKLAYKEELSSEDVFTEQVMFGLRTTGLSEDIYGKLNQEKIENFIEQGYLKKQNKKLKLEDKGVLVLDYILSEIL